MVAMVSSEKMNKVRVRAPSSTSNLGPGFDAYGLALDAFYDEVEVARSNEGGIRIEIEGEGSATIPTEPEQNTAGRTAIEFHHRFGLPDIQIRLIKRIPPGRGLASSGVSASATAVALDALLNLHLSKEELAKIAMLGEQVASGTLHADDVAPSIYGGFTIICCVE
jgi:homoserine kinase